MWKENCVPKNSEGQTKGRPVTQWDLEPGLLNSVF